MALMNLGLLHLKAAYVNAVKTEQRQSRWKTACRSALGQLEGLGKLEAFHQSAARHFPPVVKISSDDQRRLRRNQLLDVLFQRLQLLSLPASEQPQMDADTMEIFGPARHIDLAME